MRPKNTTGGGGGGGGVSDAKKTQLFPQKVILMQYRPKIQEYRPSCGKKGHKGGGSEGVVFFGRNFSRLSFLNTSLNAPQHWFPLRRRVFLFGTESLSFML